MWHIILGLLTNSQSLSCVYLIANASEACRKNFEKGVIQMVVKKKDEQLRTWWRVLCAADVTVTNKTTLTPSDGIVAVHVKYHA